MAKLKNCKSCNKEVAKGAKVCPHCGQKLKMGFWAKFGIIIVILIAVGVALAPSSEDIQNKLAEVEGASPTSTSPSGELATMFSFISDSTDIQRENKENELQGQIVEWSLPVFDVNVKSAENNVYRIQTSGDSTNVGAFVEIHARNDAEAAEIEALNPNDIIHFKGEISGTFMRNIEVVNARLVK
jgi:hypothetical protein